MKLPIADDEAMNQFRFADVSLIPQYAMSALNPTRKIGRLIAELLDVARRLVPRPRRPELIAPPDAGRPATDGPRQLPDRAVRRA